MTSSAVGTRKIRVWDLPLRLFHWVLVAAIAVALLSAEEDSALNQWHVMAGWIAGILVVFRIAWGFLGGEHSLFADFVRPSAIAQHARELLRGRPEPTVGHNALGALSVLALLTLIVLTVWTGARMSEDLHEILGWTLLGLVGVHVAAVIAMSILTRENLVSAMITGTKSSAPHRSASDARQPGGAAVMGTILIVAGAIYAVLAFDPRAFVPQGTEAFEHRMEARQGRSRADGRRDNRLERAD